MMAKERLPWYADGAFEAWVAEHDEDAMLATEVDQYQALPLSTFDTSPPPPLLIERLDPEGHTILFGTGGIGKGSLAASWITQLSVLGHRVLILDFEDHPNEWSRRIGSLDADALAVVMHVSPKETVNDDMVAAIKRQITTLGITYVVVDSAVTAIGVDPLKPEAARAYAAFVTQLGMPVLTLAHVTKADDARYPFGSVFWHNLARLTWSLTADGNNALLTHRKSNNYEKQPKQTVSMTWFNGELREVWERSHVASLGDEIEAVLEGSDGMTVAQVVNELNTEERKVSRESVRSALRRGIGPDGRFTCTSSGKENLWSLRS